METEKANPSLYIYIMQLHLNLHVGDSCPFYLRPYPERIMTMVVFVL